MAKAKTAFFYAAMVAAAFGVFYWIRSAGDSLIAPIGPGIFGHGGHRETGGVLAHVLLALVLIVLCARGLGWVFGRFNQPPVIGEMIAGIMLGPSLLGRVAPAISGYVLPNSVAPYRQAASLGVLMNSRGLMELIVLNVGLDLGVLSPTLFEMLVIMAIVTTLATTPVLHALTQTRQELAVEQTI